jgi:predicted Fe-Mo cluster-binding NifX family protein
MSGKSLSEKVPQPAVSAVPQKEKGGSYRIAIPVTDGLLSAHFGHCDEFDIFVVDREAKKIIERETAPSPPHEPGLLPRWLADRGVNLIVAGGMGPQAQQLFARDGIDVFLGAASDDPEKLVQSYLEQSLELGDNTCDHED